MQIQNSLINTVAKTYGRQNATSAADHPRSLARPEGGRPRTDSLALSPTFHEVLRTRNAVEVQPEVRAERVAALKAAVADGTYRIDDMALAARLLGKDMNAHIQPGTVLIPASRTASPQTVILAILDEELRLHQRLIAVAERKRDALLASDVETLALLVRETEGIVAAVTRLEDDCIAQVALLVGDDAPVDDTFAALAPYFTGKARHRLSGLCEGLREAVQRLRALNELNTALVRQALTFTEQWTRLVRAGLPATYDPNGATVGPPIAGRTWNA